MSLEQELARLHDAHAAALFAFLLNLTRNEADTRDLLQEIFIKLAQSNGLPAGVHNERSFLLKLAHNATFDLFRRRGAREQRNEVFAIETLSPFARAAEPDEQAFRNALAEALGELPPEQRAVVHLKLWGELTFEQIAETLEIPLNTAASRYRYGLDKMRAQLRPFYDEIR